MSTTNTYTVHGMTCGSCATKVTTAVDQVAGVSGIDVDITTGTLTVAGSDVDDMAVHVAIAKAGYQTD